MAAIYLVTKLQEGTSYDMDIRTQLLKEHSKENTELIVEYVGTDEDRAKEIMHLFLHDEYRVTQRAAWVVGHLADHHPQIFEPYIEVMLHHADQKDVHDAVRRNTARVLQFVSIPEEIQGLAYDKCYGWLANPKSPVAVKVFSMTVLANIAKGTKELEQEIAEEIKMQYDHQSKGFQARARKILKSL